MKQKKRGLNLTIIIQDETWRKLGTFKYNDADTKAKQRILRTITDAFGVKFVLIDQDLEWIE